MIHKTAIIDLKAKVSDNAIVGAYSVIGSNVEIGEGTEIQSHVSIIGNTKIGKNNKIYPFASIGNDPQDLKFNGEQTNLEIGDNNKIREYVTINPGTIGGGGTTKVGNNCLLMVSSHIAHDCMVGNNVILANNVAPDVPAETYAVDIGVMYWLPASADKIVMAAPVVISVPPN